MTHWWLSHSQCIANYSGFPITDTFRNPKIIVLFSEVSFLWGDDHGRGGEGEGEGEGEGAGGGGEGGKEYPS